MLWESEHQKPGTMYTHTWYVSVNESLHEPTYAEERVATEVAGLAEGMKAGRQRSGRCARVRGTRCGRQEE